MLDNGTMTVSDLYLDAPLPPLPDGIHSGDMLMACVEHYSAYNSGMRSAAPRLTSATAHSLPQLSPEERRLMREYQRAVEDSQQPEAGSSASGLPMFPPSDGDTFLPPLLDVDLEPTAEEADMDVDMEEDAEPLPAFNASLPLSEPSVTFDIDFPDPFFTASSPRSTPHLSQLSSHLLCVYAIVAWLHLNFHLSRVACNAVLWAFALVISSLSPSLAVPFVTLKSANHALGLDDLPVSILPVCPQCKEVFPASESTPDTCLKCATVLFKENTTSRGTRRGSRVPIVKYPTMSITSQLEAMLAVPGVEESLDGWRAKERQPGVYQDIFDGQVTKNLLGPDGKPFFANTGPGDARGPNDELRIGLAWGVDWYAFY